MSGQVSPDGKWYWDGHQWRPTSPPPPPKRSPHPGVIVAVAVVVVLAVAVFAATYVIRSRGIGTPAAERGGTQTELPDPSKTPRQPEPVTIQPGEEITTARLAQVPASGFYWELLKRQMTRPISLITNAYFQTPEKFEQRRSFYSVNQLGIDHRTGDFTSAKTTFLGGHVSTMSRCVGSKYFFRSDTAAKWSHLQSSDDECATIPRLMHSAATDGIAASGLSGKQADKVVASLRDTYDGFAHPAKPTLITVEGKTYIRQVVDYKPVKLDNGLYWGTMIFTWAFKETGLDPETWPWYTGLGPGEGLHVVYYIDPHTLLPVASVMRSTPVLDENGRVKERYDQTMVYNYAFPARLPELDVKDAKPIPVTLPEGWRIPK